MQQTPSECLQLVLTGSRRTGLGATSGVPTADLRRSLTVSSQPSARRGPHGETWSAPPEASRRGVF
jgi:hypothetical protein